MEIDSITLNWALNNWALLCIYMGQIFFGNVIIGLNAI